MQNKGNTFYGELTVTEVDIDFTGDGDVIFADDCGAGFTGGDVAFIGAGDGVLVCTGDVFKGAGDTGAVVFTDADAGDTVFAAVVPEDDCTATEAAFEINIFRAAMRSFCMRRFSVM